MKRLSIAELKAQKGAVANTEVFTGGQDSGCHIKVKIEVKSDHPVSGNKVY